MATKEDAMEDEIEDRGDDFEPTDEDTVDNEADELEDEDESEEDEVEEEEDDGDSDRDSEGEDEDDGEADSDGDGDSSEPRIPKSRLDEVIRQREYEREQAQLFRDQNAELLGLLKGAQANAATGTVSEPVKAYDFDAAEEAHMEAVLEGDVSKAKTIAAEMRAAQKAELVTASQGYKEEAMKEAAAEAVRVTDEDKFVKLIDTSTKDYEFLDPKAKGYNQTAVDEINDIFDGLTAAGKGKAASLQRAIDIVSPKFGESTKRGLGEDKGRRKKAIKKNAGAAKKQPPRMRGKTTRDKTIDEFDVNAMSDKAFKKLSKSEMAELRGDKV